VVGTYHFAPFWEWWGLWNGTPQVERGIGVGGLGAVVALAGVVAVWWKYGKGKLRFLGKKGETGS